MRGEVEGGDGGEGGGEKKGVGVGEEGGVGLVAVSVDGWGWCTG